MLEKEQAPKLFDQIAKTYDRVNRIMTFGLDRGWRKKLLQALPNPCKTYLDGATGTADQILFLLKEGFQAETIAGIDLSHGMLEIGRKKLEGFPNTTLEIASLLSIPYPDGYFDAITVSFGVRNVTDLEKCLKELHRVLKTGGTCAILECSRPTNPLFAFMHRLYMQKIMPAIGGLFSSHKQAYTYLEKTSADFPSGERFVSLLNQAGFTEPACYPLTFGVVSLYVGKK